MKLRSRQGQRASYMYEAQGSQHQILYASSSIRVASPISSGGCVSWLHTCMKVW
jgi:hypothetical protein